MSTTYNQYLVAESATSSGKFWEVQVVGNQMQTRYGKVGQDKSWTFKSFDSPEKALKEAQKKANAKMKKGYEEVQPENTMSFEELFSEVRSLTESRPDLDTLEKVARSYQIMQDQDRPRVRAEVDTYLFDKVEQWGNDALKEVRVMLSPCATTVKKALLKQLGSVRTQPRDKTFAAQHLDDAHHIRAGAWIEAYYNGDYIQVMDHMDHGMHSDGTPVMYMSIAMNPPHDQDYIGIDILSPKKDPMVCVLDESGGHMMDKKAFSKWL